MTVRLMEGSEAIAEAMVAAGCSFFAGYPMTPFTEVLEHMHDPQRELARIDALLVPGGWLGLMTELRPPMADFARWHYHRDPTHVGFHSEASLRWIAARFGWQVESAGRRVILLRRP